MRIRFAGPEDAEALNTIYQQAIDAPTPQSPHAAPMQLEERRAWIAQRPARRPVFVYDGGPQGILGFSSLSPTIFRPRCEASAQVAVYLDLKARSATIGASLFFHLILVAKRLGYRSLTSLVFEDNVASCRATSRLYRQVGCLANAAFHKGRWRNILLFQRVLGSPEDAWIEEQFHRRRVEADFPSTQESVRA